MKHPQSAQEIEPISEEKLPEIENKNLPSTEVIEKEKEPENGKALSQKKPSLVTDLYQKASMLKISKKEREELEKPVDELDINIRPDGLIYYAQTFVRERLNSAFGPGSWAMIEHSTIKDAEHNKFYYIGSLYVRGFFIAKAVGESQYFPYNYQGKPNPNFSWGSIHESAKSDCIVRACKDLGVGKELWQPRYCREWISKYAVKVWRTKTGKNNEGDKGSYQWRMKDAEPFYDEVANPKEAQKVEAEDLLKKLRVRAHIELDKFWKTGKCDRDTLYKWIQSSLNLSEAEAHISKLDSKQINFLLDHAKKNPPTNPPNAPQGSSTEKKKADTKKASENKEIPIKDQLATAPDLIRLKIIWDRIPKDEKPIYNDIKEKRKSELEKIKDDDLSHLKIDVKTPQLVADYITNRLLPFEIDNFILVNKILIDSLGGVENPLIKSAIEELRG